MDKKSFYARNRASIFCLCFIAAFLIVAIPHGVMCSGGLFSNSAASENALNDICSAITQWAFIPFFIFLGIAGFAHNSKVKWAFLGSAGFVLLVYVACLNPTFIKNTADEIAAWFGSLGTSTSTE